MKPINLDHLEIVRSHKSDDVLFRMLRDVYIFVLTIIIEGEDEFMLEIDDTEEEKIAFLAAASKAINSLYIISPKHIKPFIHVSDFVIVPYDEIRTELKKLLCTDIVRIIISYLYQICKIFRTLVRTKKS